MIDKLTILIPVYNDDASSLVQALVAEARNVKGLDYEIIVFDDGSTDARCIDANHRLALLPGCNYVSAPHHHCRASMRNAMLRQGRYEWCLMIDARLRPANPFHQSICPCWRRWLRCGMRWRCSGWWQKRQETLP